MSPLPGKSGHGAAGMGDWAGLKILEPGMGPRITLAPIPVPSLSAPAIQEVNLIQGDGAQAVHEFLSSAGARTHINFLKECEHGHISLHRHRRGSSGYFRLIELVQSGGHL